MIKRIGFVLIVVVFFWTSGCEPGEEIPTPSQGSVIGNGALNFNRTYSDSFPTAQQTVKEVGTIPFEIYFGPSGSHEVEGSGVVTLNHEINYTPGGLCVYQAVAKVEVDGDLYEPDVYPSPLEADLGKGADDPLSCYFDFVLRFDYPGNANLISGDPGFCGVYEVPQTSSDIKGMRAINGTSVKSTNGGLNEEIVLSNLALDKVKECKPPSEDDIK